jgi:uncharacterized protein YdaU (DUF1376 family)
VGFSTQVHGSNSGNFSVSLSQTSKNDISFLLSLMFSLQQTWRGGQNRFYPEVCVYVCGEMAQTMNTHMSKFKNDKNERRKKQRIQMNTQMKEMQR